MQCTIRDVQQGGCTEYILAEQVLLATYKDIIETDKHNIYVYKVFGKV